LPSASVSGHDGILRFHRTFAFDRRRVVVFAFADGGDLQSRLDVNGMSEMVEIFTEEYLTL
jgi:hypothetical protein